ncbi:hypothetical protein Sjap_018530 [Stephania japonica]|uniref:BZIP domain-containing protein n=1 Tax=Stephania japonica TaxID=461633 RepID=A0AAP0NLM7_9MAGN
MEPQFNPTFDGAQYPGRMDIEQMPETPQRVSHHRRAQSETFFRLPDDFLFDAADVDVDFAALSPIDIPSISDDAASAAAAAAAVAAENPKGGKPPLSHFRSLSVGSEFFEGLGFQGISGGGGGGGDGGGQERRGHHRHSNSMDGSSSSFEAEAAEMAKKAMGPDKLAELARIDPKRAKRILANRQSAARSKERKIRYTGELERKVQTLQTEATTLSTQVTMLQVRWALTDSPMRDPDLKTESLDMPTNHIEETLNDALKDEVQRLKIATGQAPAINGNSFNRGLSGSFLSPLQPLHNFNNPQNQHHQQLNVSPSSINNQSHGGPLQHKRV